MKNVFALTFAVISTVCSAQDAVPAPEAPKPATPSAVCQNVNNPNLTMALRLESAEACKFTEAIKECDGAWKAKFLTNDQVRVCTRTADMKRVTGRFRQEAVQELTLQALTEKK